MAIPKKETSKRSKVVWTKRSSESMTNVLLKEKLGNKISVVASYRSPEVRIDPNLDWEIQKAAKLHTSGSGYDFLEQVREMFFDGPITAKRAVGVARRIKTTLPKVKVVLYSNED